MFHDIWMNMPDDPGPRRRRTDRPRFRLAVGAVLLVTYCGTAAAGGLWLCPLFGR